MNDIQKKFEKWKVEREVDEYNESYRFREGYVKAMCDAINLVKNLDISLVSGSFDSLIDRLERASNIKYPNRQWTALFKAEQKMNWKGKDKLLLERVERLESELYER